MDSEYSIIVYLIISVVAGIACGFACEKIAKSKGYPVGSWWLIGFFFSFLALVGVVLIPAKKTKGNQAGAPSMNMPNQSPISNGYATNNMQNLNNVQNDSANVQNTRASSYKASDANLGSWSCPVCMTKNTGTDSRCKKCGRRRP